MTVNEWEFTEIHNKLPFLNPLNSMIYFLGIPNNHKKRELEGKKKKKNPNTTTQYLPTKKPNNNNRAWHWS
jgi:hypothetical protein